MPDDWLDLRQAAQLLELSTREVLDLVDRELLPAAHRGDEFVFRRADVDAYRADPV